MQDLTTLRAEGLNGFHGLLHPVRSWGRDALGSTNLVLNEFRYPNILSELSIHLARRRRIVR